MMNTSLVKGLLYIDAFMRQSQVEQLPKIKLTFASKSDLEHFKSGIRINNIEFVTDFIHNFDNMRLVGFEIELKSNFGLIDLKLEKE